ncbi:MAG: DNA repair protein RecN [Solobacterium sp.]|nr:DNA repair protein RecN [Solobacterium sp.]
MITHLYIKNFVLIDEADLDAEEGFSAFVGETGAGKSIFIDALGLLSAERANASLVGKNGDRAIIEGTFALKDNPHAVAVLEEAGFDVEDETVFTRELSSSGKSTVRIDHRTVRLSFMREVLQNEIDIHGQRDTEYLLNAREHLHYLDAYAGDQDLCRDTAMKYDVWKALCNERDQALNETYNESEIEFLEHQIKEIDDAGLHEGEEEELLERERRGKALRNSLDSLLRSVSLYEAVSDGLYELNKCVQSIDDSLAEGLKQAVNDSYYTIDDAVSQLRHTANTFDYSEREIDAIEERLFLIQKLKRKYGRSIPAILERRSVMQDQVDRAANRAAWLEDTEKKINAAYAAYEASAMQLRHIRKDAAKHLDQAVLESIEDLYLPHARFETVITEGEPSSSGLDKAEFMISMNKGEDLKPLNAVASGGELSRFMLGIKTVFTRLHGIRTVIFDEIDTGVSGKVASAIGKKMQKLSDDAQVFAVTHSAPVAACADLLYLVAKQTEGERTRTYIDKLDDAQSVEQLALIASGKLTEASLKAAAELFERSRRD